MHEIQKVAVEVAEAIGHRRAPPADRHRDVVVRQQHLPRAACIGSVPGDDIGAVDLAVAFLFMFGLWRMSPSGARWDEMRSGFANGLPVLSAPVACINTCWNKGIHANNADSFSAKCMRMFQDSMT